MNETVDEDMNKLIREMVPSRFVNLLHYYNRTHLD